MRPSAKGLLGAVAAVVLALATCRCVVESASDAEERKSNQRTFSDRRAKGDGGRVARFGRESTGFGTISGENLDGTIAPRSLLHQSTDALHPTVSPGEIAAFEQRIAENYAGLPNLVTSVDCTEAPCIAAVTASSGAGTAHEELREDMAVEDDGSEWCGEIRGVANAIAVVIECYDDVTEDVDRKSRTAARVSDLLQRFTEEVYPQDGAPGDECDADADCESFACEPGSLLGCDAPRCCAVRCRDGVGCPHADLGMVCVPWPRTDTTYGELDTESASLKSIARMATGQGRCLLQVGPEP